MGRARPKMVKIGSSVLVLNVKPRSFSPTRMAGPDAGASAFPGRRFSGTKVPMAAQETLQPKKRRGPAPTGQGVPVQVRLHPAQLDPLDAWIADQPEPKPSRPEAIREALTQHLKTRGYLK